MAKKEKKIEYIPYWYVVDWEITMTTNRKPLDEESVWFEYDGVIELTNEEYNKIQLEKYKVKDWKISFSKESK